jgi:hypothetical protein
VFDAVKAAPFLKLFSKNMLAMWTTLAPGSRNLGDNTTERVLNSPLMSISMI